MTWRVGRQLGRTLYRDEVFVGTVDTPEIAAEIVAAMNAAAARDVCWHCKDCLEPAPMHCERCPAQGDCDDASCQVEGCALD